LSEGTERLWKIAVRGLMERERGRDKEWEWEWE